MLPDEMTGSDITMYILQITLVDGRTESRGNCGGKGKLKIAGADEPTREISNRRKKITQCS